MTIHAAVGLPEPVPRPAFVDPERDPRYYVARYDAEPAFRQWFDENFPGVTIYEAAGTNESAMNRTAFGQCGIGTRLVGGECVAPDPPPIEAGPEPPEPEPKPAAPEPPPPPRDPRPGGCLIATAAHGSEMSQQVQMLREVRDRTLLSTASGAGFADGFNALYYSFSPAVADAQRESPLLREAIRALIAPDAPLPVRDDPGGGGLGGPRGRGGGLPPSRSRWARTWQPPCWPRRAPLGWSGPGGAARRRAPGPGGRPAENPVPDLV